MSDNLDTLVVEEPETLVIEEKMHSEDSLLIEEEMHSEDSLVIEEESKVPGSDTIIEVEEVQEAKDTDWANDKDHSKFVSHLKNKLTKIPKHSGNTLPGCERAIFYLKDLQNELSKAMRSDLEGKIEEKEADDLYKDINKKIELLENQINKLRTNTITQNRAFASIPQFKLVSEEKCNKCNSIAPSWHDVENDRIVCLNCESSISTGELNKVAATPYLQVHINAFERAIVGTLINASVSNGKNIEDVYHKLNDKYKFTDREKLSLQQILSDYGFPILMDRAKIEENNGENDGELARNYPA